MKVRDNSKCREWERQRRDRLADAFKALVELLPNYDPARIPARNDILDKATQFIKELRLSNSRLITDQTQCTEMIRKVKDLQDEVNKLILRVKQLTALLIKANITIPNGPSIKSLGKRTCKWSNKLKAENIENIHVPKIIKITDIENKSMPQINQKPSKTVITVVEQIGASEHLATKNSFITGNNSNTSTVTSLKSPTMAPVKAPSSNAPPQKKLPTTLTPPPTALPPPPTAPQSAFILTPIQLQPQLITRINLPPQPQSILSKIVIPCTSLQKIPIKSIVKRVAKKIRKPRGKAVRLKKTQGKSEFGTQTDETETAFNESSETKVESQNKNEDISNSGTNKQIIEQNESEPMEQVVSEEPQADQPNNSQFSDVQGIASQLPSNSVQNEVDEPYVIAAPKIATTGEKQSGVEIISVKAQGEVQCQSSTEENSSLDTSGHGVNDTPPNMSDPVSVALPDIESKKIENDPSDQQIREARPTTMTFALPQLENDFTPHKSQDINLQKLSTKLENFSKSQQTNAQHNSTNSDDLSKSKQISAPYPDDHTKFHHINPHKSSTNDTEINKSQPTNLIQKSHSNLDGLSKCSVLTQVQEEQVNSPLTSPAITRIVNFEMDMNDEHRETLPLRSVPSARAHEPVSLDTEKMSECIARSIGLMEESSEETEAELMELGTDWGDVVGVTHSPKSPISPTQMFLSMFPLLPRETLGAVPVPMETAHPQGQGNSTTQAPKTCRSSFFIDSMLPDESNQQQATSITNFDPFGSGVLGNQGSVSKRLPTDGDSLDTILAPLQPLTRDKRNSEILSLSAFLNSTLEPIPKHKEKDSSKNDATSGLTATVSTHNPTPASAHASGSASTNMSVSVSAHLCPQVSAHSSDAVTTHTSVTSSRTNQNPTFTPLNPVSSAPSTGAVGFYQNFNQSQDQFFTSYQNKDHSSTTFLHHPFTDSPYVAQSGSMMVASSGSSGFQVDSSYTFRHKYVETCLENVSTQQHAPTPPTQHLQKKQTNPPTQPHHKTKNTKNSASQPAAASASAAAPLYLTSAHKSLSRNRQDTAPSFPFPNFHQSSKVAESKTKKTEVSPYFNPVSTSVSAQGQGKGHNLRPPVTSAPFQPQFYTTPNFQPSRSTSGHVQNTSHFNDAISRPFYAPTPTQSAPPPQAPPISREPPPFYLAQPPQSQHSNAYARNTHFSQVDFYSPSAQAQGQGQLYNSSAPASEQKRSQSYSQPQPSPHYSSQQVHVSDPSGQGQSQVRTSHVHNPGQVAASQSQGQGQVSASRSQGHGQVSASQSQGQGQVSASQSQGHGQVSASQSQGHGQVSASQSQGHGQVSASQSQGHGQVSASQSLGQGQVSAPQSQSQGQPTQPHSQQRLNPPANVTSEHAPQKKAQHVAHAQPPAQQRPVNWMTDSPYKKGNAFSVSKLVGVPNTNYGDAVIRQNRNPWNDIHFSPNMLQHNTHSSQGGQGQGQGQSQQQSSTAPYVPPQVQHEFQAYDQRTPQHFHHHPQNPNYFNQTHSQPHQGPTSNSISNFNLSSIFPEINDKGPGQQQGKSHCSTYYSNRK